MKKISLIVVFTVGLIFRLYRITSPVADWHSHRQADTASVTRHLSQNISSFFTPLYHDLGDVQSGQENPQGYRMVELPLYNLFSLLVAKISFQSIEIGSRLTSILFSLGSGYLIFLITQRLTNLFWPSLLSLATFLFLPFSIYYSRSILPENTAVFFMLLCLYFFPKDLIVSGISLSLSLLTKPFTGFVILPVLFYLTVSHRPALFKLLVFSLISLGPFFLWRQHISQFPEGIPASAWLFNNNPNRIFPEWFRGYSLAPLNRLVAFRPSWFNWLFNVRLHQLILGTFGLVPFTLGFVYRHRQTRPFNFFLFLGTLAYFIIVAQGNIQHDYYQILVIPQISISLGLWLYFLSKQSTTIALTSAFFSLLLGWLQIKNYYHINNPNIVAAGQQANKIIPQDAIVIAPYNGDTTFLYQTNRSGYPVEIYDLAKIKSLHPSRPLYLVSVDLNDYTNKLVKTATVIFQNQQFLIAKL